LALAARLALIALATVLWPAVKADQPMSTKSRWIIAARIRAEGARQAAQKAVREADRAESRTMVDPDGSPWRPAQPSPTIGQCLNGGYISARGGPRDAINDEAACLKLAR
jgi:hypothetical protein